jgi:hypothetical protein
MCAHYTHIIRILHVRNTWKNCLIGVRRLKSFDLNSVEKVLTKYELYFVSLKYKCYNIYVFDK